MQYRLIRIFPYNTEILEDTEAPQAEVLETFLRDGWQLHGSPFTARNDEYFQAVVRKKTASEQSGGTVTAGLPGRITNG